MFLQKQLTLFKNHDGEFTFVYDAKAVFFTYSSIIFFMSYSSKRRSYALRSKTKINQLQSSNEHSDIAPPTFSLKKGKIDNKKASTENVLTLTRKFGKFRRKCVYK